MFFLYMGATLASVETNLSRIAVASARALRVLSVSTERKQVTRPDDLRFDV